MYLLKIIIIQQLVRKAHTNLIFKKISVAMLNCKKCHVPACSQTAKGIIENKIIN